MRAVDLMAPFVNAGERVVVQHGCTEPDLARPGLEWIKFMDHEDLMDAVTESRAFFCHAGVGSVITSLMRNTMPIVIARESRFGEHIDDHQLDLASRLEERGLVLVLDRDNPDAEAAADRASTADVGAQQRGQELFKAVSALTRASKPTR